MKNTFAILVVILLLSACVAKRSASHISAVPSPESIAKKGESFWMKVAQNMWFKKITPEMEIQLEDLMARGCVPEYEILESDTAYMYSILPGMGQIYTGEPEKALMYILSSILIVPYLVSFEDAQSSVDYLNAQYSIGFCKKMLRLSKNMEERDKNREFIDRIMQDQSQKKMNNP